LGRDQKVSGCFLEERNRPQIAKIVRFGSTLKKTAHESSDVDIFIITGDGETVQDGIADVLLEFQM